MSVVCGVCLCVCVCLWCVCVCVCLSVCLLYMYMYVVCVSVVHVHVCGVCFCVDEQKWVKIDASGYQPRGRRSLSSARYGDSKVIYFGGFNNRLNRHFNDVFIYDSRK